MVPISSLFTAFRIAAFLPLVHSQATSLLFTFPDPPGTVPTTQTSEVSPQLFRTELAPPLALILSTTTLPFGAVHHIIGVPATETSPLSTATSLSEVITIVPREVLPTDFITITTTLSPSITPTIKGFTTIFTPPPLFTTIQLSPPPLALSFSTTTLPFGAVGYTSFFPASTDDFNRYIIGVPATETTLPSTGAPTSPIGSTSTNAESGASPTEVIIEVPSALPVPAPSSEAGSGLPSEEDPSPGPDPEPNNPSRPPYEDPHPFVGPYPWAPNEGVLPRPPNWKPNRPRPQHQPKPHNRPPIHERPEPDHTDTYPASTLIKKIKYPTSEYQG